MNFNIFNKKKKEEKKNVFEGIDEKKNVFEGIDEKFNCEEIIRRIEKDLNVELFIEDFAYDDIEKCVVVRAKAVCGDDINEYLITINEPMLDDSIKPSEIVCPRNFYKERVILYKGYDTYIDYVFNGWIKEQDGREHYVLSSHRRYERFTNDNVSVILESNQKNPPYVEYIVTKGDRRVKIVTNNTNWRLDAILKELINLGLTGIYCTIKKVDNNIGLNILIEITDESTKSSEQLYINDGNLITYNKSFVEDGVLVSFEYREGKLVKKTKLIEEDIDKLKTRDASFDDTISKIKILKGMVHIEFLSH